MKGGNDDMMDLWRSRSPGRPVFASMRVGDRFLLQVVQRTGP